MIGRDLISTAVIVLAGVGILAGMGAYTRYLTRTITHLEQQLEVAEARARSASATIKLLRAELESDDAVNNLSDDDLRNVPDIWLRGTPDGR